MANFLSLIFNFHIGCLIFVTCVNFFSSYLFFIEQCPRSTILTGRASQSISSWCSKISTRREDIQTSRWSLMIKLNTKLTRLSLVLAVQSSGKSLIAIQVNILWFIWEEFTAMKWTQYYSSCILERQDLIRREWKSL